MENITIKFSEDISWQELLKLTAAKRIGRSEKLFLVQKIYGTFMYVQGQFSPICQADTCKDGCGVDTSLSHPLSGRIY